MEEEEEEEEAAAEEEEEMEQDQESDQESDNEEPGDCQRARTDSAELMPARAVRRTHLRGQSAPSSA